MSAAAATAALMTVNCDEAEQLINDIGLGIMVGVALLMIVIMVSARK